jgi:hypothetical protein
LRCSRVSSIEMSGGGVAMSQSVAVAKNVVFFAHGIRRFSPTSQADEKQTRFSIYVWH